MEKAETVMTKSIAAITSSDPLHCIQFATNEDYEAFNAEYLALIRKYRKMNEERYGYWAGNQNKFVKSMDDMSPWDKESYYRNMYGDSGRY
jgi:hypothetical protein